MAIGRQVMIPADKGVHIEAAEVKLIVHLAMAVMEVCSHFFTFAYCTIVLLEAYMHTFVCICIMNLPATVRLDRVLFKIDTELAL